MSSNIASSKALGFGVLGISTWMFYVTRTGLVLPAGADPGIMHLVMTVAALGLLLAGIMAFVRHEGWLAFFFLLWAGMAWGSVHTGGDEAGMAHGSALFFAWFAITITLVNLYLWVASMKDDTLGTAVSLVVLLLWVSWLLMALSAFLDIWILGRIGNIVSLASAVVAFYVSAGNVLARSGSGMKLPCIARGDEPAHQG